MSLFKALPVGSAFRSLQRLSPSGDAIGRHFSIQTSQVLIQKYPRHTSSLRQLPNFCLTELCARQLNPTLNLPRAFSNSAPLLQDTEESKEQSPKKLGIVARFKQLCKDYWYVIVPVHASTSVIWFGSFYILVKSGVDVTAVLSSLGVTEAYLEKIANSEWSYVALASACYKLASPARYTVTVGASTFAVKYLKEWGYLRTSKEVAQDFKVKIDNVEDKVMVRWNEYREGRRRRKARKSRKASKPKKE